MKVTSGMVAAGVKVLRESGCMEGQSSADWPLVRRLLEVAIAAREEVAQEGDPTMTATYVPARVYSMRKK